MLEICLPEPSAKLSFDLFFFCNFIKDFFSLWRCPTKGAAQHLFAMKKRILNQIPLFKLCLQNNHGLPILTLEL